MTVNSISGLNQYTNQQNTDLAASQTAHDTSLKQQPADLSDSNLNSNNTDTTKQAFKVDITSKAKELYATKNKDGSTSEANQSSAAAQTPAANETQPSVNNNGGQQAQQLVNIIA